MVSSRTRVSDSTGFVPDNAGILKEVSLISFTHVAKDKKGKKVCSGKENVVTEGRKNVRTC